ncbi:MAG: hypothetical protein QOK41_1602 [Sphingomonadales bacterium]|nr:hypothetical protein [Sphingomonadales bacterium]
MAYGLSTRVRSRNEQVQRALDRASGSWGGYRAWHQLDPDSRLDLVERALDPANDCFDARPLAL